MGWKGFYHDIISAVDFILGQLDSNTTTPMEEVCGLQQGRGWKISLIWLHSIGIPWSANELSTRPKCVCVCVWVHEYMCVSVCERVYVCMWGRVYMHVSILVYICVCVIMYLCKPVLAYVSAHTSTKLFEGLSSWCNG